MKKWEKIVKMNENNIENKKRIIDLIDLKDGWKRNIKE